MFILTSPRTDVFIGSLVGHGMSAPELAKGIERIGKLTKKQITEKHIEKGRILWFLQWIRIS